MDCPNQVSLDPSLTWSKRLFCQHWRKEWRAALSEVHFFTENHSPKTTEFYLRHPHSLGCLLQELCSPLISVRCYSPLRWVASCQISVTTSCNCFLSSFGWKEVWEEIPDPPHCQVGGGSHSMWGTTASASTTASGKKPWDKVIKQEMFSHGEVPSWLATPRTSISGLPTS